MRKTLFENAVDAYYKYCEQNNFVYTQPNENLSRIGWKYVHLNNINGVLAKYVIATKEIIVK